MGKESIQIMGNLKYSAEVEGVTSNLADSVDDYFDGLATESAALGSFNTRTEWATTKHIKWSDNPLIQHRTSRVNTANTQTAYALGSFTTIAHGNNGTTEQTFTAVTVNAGDVLRYHFNINVYPEAAGLDTDAGNDYWWIKLQYQTGGSTWVDMGFDTRNSVGSNRGSGFTKPVNGFRRYGISFVEIMAGDTTITGIRAQINLEDTGHTIRLENWTQDMRIIGG